MMRTIWGGSASQTTSQLSLLLVVIVVGDGAAGGGYDSSQHTDPWFSIRRESRSPQDNRINSRCRACPCSVTALTGVSREGSGDVGQWLFGRDVRGVRWSRNGNWSPPCGERNPPHICFFFLPSTKSPLVGKFEWSKKRGIGYSDMSAVISLLNMPEGGEDWR